MMTLLNQFYEQNKDKIEFIFIGGSSCLSYIDNSGDIDVFVVYKEYSENVEEKIFSLLNIQNDIRKINDKVSIVSQYKEILRKWLDGSVQVNSKLTRRSELPTYVYLCKDFQIVCGEDTVGIKALNILDSSIYDRLVARLKEYRTKLIAYYEKNSKYPKYIYHLLTVLYIIKNNSYELTEEQITNIKKAHNMKCTKTLYNWVINEINKL